jgi:hypothetical protein
MRHRSYGRRTTDVAVCVASLLVLVYRMHSAQCQKFNVLDPVTAWMVTELGVFASLMRAAIAWP